MSEQWGSPGGRPPEPWPFGQPGSLRPPVPASPPPAGGNGGPPLAGPPAGLPPVDGDSGSRPGVGWEPPPAVYQQYATAPSGSDRSPDGLRALAIAVSAIKAIPLVFGLVLLVFLVALADDIEGLDPVDSFDGAVLVVALVFLLFIGIGALLLFFQVRSVLKNQMLALGIVAGIIAGLDLLVLLGGLIGSDPSAGGVAFMLVVFSAQAAIVVWAFRLRNGSRI